MKTVNHPHEVAESDDNSVLRCDLLRCRPAHGGGHRSRCGRHDRLLRHRSFHGGQRRNKFTDGDDLPSILEAPIQQFAGRFVARFPDAHQADDQCGVAALGGSNEVRPAWLVYPVFTPMAPR